MELSVDLRKTNICEYLASGKKFMAVQEVNCGMDYKSPHFKRFKHDFLRIADKYSINPQGLKVEFYMPGQQAIFIEKIEDEAYKVHINLQEERIISIQRVSGTGKPDSDKIRKKYRQYMH